MRDFLKELTRRKVWLFGGIYLALGWVLLQVAVVVESTLSLPGWVDQIALVLLALGFPVALLLAWAQESSVERKELLVEKEAPDDKPSNMPAFSVAVLALNNLSDERDLGWIAEGLSEDIITRLGTVHFLKVTARNSSFAWKGQAPDIRDVGKSLNVRYVVEGSIRVIGETLRITAQLIDAETGGHIWSDNYDHPKDNPGNMQDEVVDIVSGEVLSIILNAEIDRLLQVKSEDLTVEDYIGLCWGKGVRDPTADGIGEAIELLKRGLERFPQAHELHAEMAFYCCNMALSYDSGGRAKLLEESEKHLQKAIAIAPRAAMTLWRHSTVRNMLGQFDEALLVGEQMASLFPHERMAPVLCDTYRILGRYKEAIDVANNWLETAGKRHFDRRMVLWFKGSSLLGLRDFAGAETVLREAATAPPLPHVQLALIVALAHQGKLDEAHAACERYKALPNAKPLETVKKSVERRSKDPAWVEIYFEGFRLADWRGETDQAEGGDT